MGIHYWRKENIWAKRENWEKYEVGSWGKALLLWWIVSVCVECFEFYTKFGEVSNHLLCLFFYHCRLLLYLPLRSSLSLTWQLEFFLMSITSPTLEDSWQDFSLALFCYFDPNLGGLKANIFQLVPASTLSTRFTNMLCGWFPWCYWLLGKLLNLNFKFSIWTLRVIGFVHYTCSSFSWLLISICLLDGSNHIAKWSDLKGNGEKFAG